MASHVVVVDATARRTTIKTTPGKYLSDVLNEACAKLGVKADQYTLKHNNKQIDLSRTYRLSGLPSGAKLDLVQSSRSPSAVSVALQPPDGGSRLTQKFPSNTSLWQILRVFESNPGSDGAPQNLNFTQRGTPQMGGAGSSGGGRLNYEMPVLNVMGRDLGTFVDLQKTLAQLGINNGSALLRLSFKNSGQPLEEAMGEISKYFSHAQEPLPATTEAHGAHAGSAGEAQSIPEPEKATATEDIAGLPNPDEPEPMEDMLPTSTDPTSDTIPEKRKHDDVLTPVTEPTESEALPDNAIVGPDQRLITIFAPPSGTTPQAAREAFNAADYEPTVDHAKLHQARLLSESRNRRLPSDAELAAQEKERSEKLARISEVVLRIRLPDQSVVQMTVGRLDTAEVLYGRVRELLAHADQPFVLRLVPDLGFQGRVMMYLVWSENASLEAQREPSLKKEWREQAQEMNVQQPVEAPAEEPSKPAEGAVDKGKKKADDPDKESKLKKLFMGKLSKK
ncbi:hypothetical protein H2199_003388 [Coniosporium tulheliwenetii]|uniref:Uncharacterized protein n=1 Tax=Coniosporium tulheliwenetii TaxID=3383036 RepID=A0ACC2ZD32_9PEZI|nr:hypothetical protein H2199_003388 [Cladosporium sp. JES 115]